MDRERFEQLKKDGEDMVSSLKKRKSFIGIKNLLTDLYPDEAHFIYELLQNAEDTKATTVSFLLFEDRLEFEHNGIRNFTIEDIDAITSIGNNLEKRNDPTKIGKFGIGFKSVFAYTETPHIHSREYHFKIRDHYIVDDFGVDKIETNGLTRFIFPFDNDDKPAKKAFDEIKAGLKAIDENSLLFLRHIKKIEYILPDDEFGFIESNIVSDNILKIITSYHGIDETVSHWMRFQKRLCMDSEYVYGKFDELDVSVAFALECIETKNSVKYNTIPIEEGGVYIYFPARKERSGLKFHINAPFASTVARDSVRQCEENEIIISNISDLIVDSLENIKDMGLLTSGFLAVLPNFDDEIKGIYEVIYNDLISAFKTGSYTPAKEGGFELATNLIQANPPAISNIFKDIDRPALFEDSLRWTINSEGRVNVFLKSLEINQFNYESILKLFEDGLSKIENFIITKDINWLKRFYALLYNACDKFNLHRENYFVSILKQSKIILTERGEYVCPKDVYILTKKKSVSHNVSIVKNDLHRVNENDNNSNETEKRLYKFFKHKLEIKDYNRLFVKSSG